MKRLFDIENMIPKNRFVLIYGIVSLVIFLLISRLWFLQIYKGKEYHRLSDSNRISKIEIPAPRGSIYDRNGKTVLDNKIYYDLIYTPQFVKSRDNTLKIISKILNTPYEDLDRHLRRQSQAKKFEGVIIKKNMTLKDVAVIDSNKVFLPGISVAKSPRRSYSNWTPSHLVGYLGELSEKDFKGFNDQQRQRYKVGDLIGKQGLEKKWESYLKGDRGYKYIQVDAHGHKVKFSTLKNLPEKVAERGSNLNLTLDYDLQKTAQDAFKGKFGALVALDPNSGEILSILSEPRYDLQSFQLGMSYDEWRELNSNPFTPMLDKTVSGMFPPGSPYKIVLAAAGLEQKIITPRTTFDCPGHFEFGNEKFHCHDRAGHGKVNLKKALKKSCDVYFYNLGLELGVDVIAMYAREFGLGKKQEYGLNYEKPGLVPTSAWHYKHFNKKWNQGETPNISIGQGFNLVTPLQLATLIAFVANKGKIWQPHILKSITDHLGNTVKDFEPKLLSQSQLIQPKTFNLISKYLTSVVEDEDGTGKRARVEGIQVAGKTGTAQVISLDKTKDQLDVSMRWKEHAIFVAFAPAKNPEIAIAVYSQHDRTGGGGVAAAPVASKIIDKFMKLKQQRASFAKTDTDTMDRR